MKYTVKATICFDCKHWKEKKDKNGYGLGYGFCEKFGDNTDEDEFCSRGETTDADDIAVTMEHIREVIGERLHDYAREESE